MMPSVARQFVRIIAVPAGAGLLATTALFVLLAWISADRNDHLLEAAEWDLVQNISVAALFAGASGQAGLVGALLAAGTRVSFRRGAQLCAAFIGSWLCAHAIEFMTPFLLLPGVLFGVMATLGSIRCRGTVQLVRLLSSATVLTLSWLGNYLLSTLDPLASLDWRGSTAFLLDNSPLFLGNLTVLMMFLLTLRSRHNEDFFASARAPSNTLG